MKEYFITLVLLVILAMSIRATLGLRKGVDRLDNAKARLEETKQKNDELKEQIEYVQSEEYIEKAALEELNLVEPESRVLVLESAKTKKNIELENDEADSFEKPNWKLWLMELNLAKTQ